MFIKLWLAQRALNFPKANILVIDDTPENLNLLSAMLTEQGYKVWSVTKGSTEKFAKVFRSSPNPIAIATVSEARFIDVNPSFLKMSGYCLKKVIGDTATKLNLGKSTGDRKIGIRNGCWLERIDCSFWSGNLEYSCQL
ncbi:PAS domain-containing protein [Nostoc sp. LPT]|uniref:PAS domain-containing protein n=1 Tax=Nostoc sp. LPT TaxID=2815387 RepID=UPI0025CDA268|nr:PAS domain-containing protein [Nostoc sp. LPT]